jgi:predicted kinase
MGHIVIISGPPGAGKSTVSRILAEKSPYERAAHIHTDDFYGYIRKGFIKPWMPGAEEQNIAVSKAMASCAKNYAEAGYEVFADGLIGDWFLNHWLEPINDGIDVHYAILLPPIKTMLLRNENRENELSPNDIHGITEIYNMVSSWNQYRTHFIDSTNQSPDETAAIIRHMISEGHLRIK